LDKAMALLGAVEGGARSLGDLVATTGMARPTAHRLAAALVAHGLLRRDGEARYLPGLRLIALGRAASQALPLAQAAQRPLEELRDATGESAQLYVRAGDGRICVATAESSHGLRTIVPLGAVLELQRGSAGRLLLGDPDALAAGWAESVGEREPGVASVSAPVFQAGRVVAAVSVSGPVERTSRRPGARYAGAVMAAARAVERAAGLH
jgi:DNA-binding IclR family transcriptional regulator